MRFPDVRSLLLANVWIESRPRHSNLDGLPVPSTHKIIQDAEIEF